MKLEVKGENREFSAVSMGNPHCVMIVDDLSDELILSLGPALECHEYFPQRTNVEFVKLLTEDSVKIRIWERGVGETLACGTGNAGVFAVLRKLGLINSDKLMLESPGGSFELEENEAQEILLTGPADYAYAGEVDFDSGN